MKVTTYTCDRCKKSETTNDNLQLLYVAVGLRRERYDSYRPGYSLDDKQLREQEWCVNCRTELGIHEPIPKQPVPGPVYPSLEEMIREIIREEVHGG